LHRGDQPLAGLDAGGGERGGVEDLPVGGADLFLGRGGNFCEDIAGPVKP